MKRFLVFLVGGLWAAAPAFAQLDPDRMRVEVMTGTLLAGVDAIRARNRVTAAMSDHGEGLGDHGEISHGTFLFDTTLRVPLILHGGGNVPYGQHFTFATPNAPWAECFVGSVPGVPLEEAAGPGQAVPVDGWMVPGDSPGFGIEVPAEAIGPYRY